MPGAMAAPVPFSLRRLPDRWFVPLVSGLPAETVTAPATYVTLGCFTNGTIAQVVTNSLSPLSGQHLYDGSGATV